jgi:voltage-gated sodium channel
LCAARAPPSNGLPNGLANCRTPDDVAPLSARQREGTAVTSTQNSTQWNASLRRIVEANWFQKFIVGVIVVNAIGLGLETIPSVAQALRGPLALIDDLALIIFTLEIAAKLIVYRLGYFKDPWNVFDFTIVGIALLPMGGGLSVMRALRILRALRIVSVVPAMRRVVEGLLLAIPSLGAVMALLAILFYISAVMATKLFGSEFDELFGNFGRSLFTLFQIMTLEGWTDGVVRPIMKVYPYAWLFFIPFILTVTFAVLNLFIAIIVNSMEEAAKSDTDMLHQDAAKLHADALRQEEQHQTLMAEIRALREEIAAFRASGRSGG